jgi:DNA-directed RNA polymerase I and III subunit RPAC1
MMFDHIVQKENKLSFDINDIDVSIVNAIRRIILSEVQSIAFAFDPNAKENAIKVINNTGSLHNEFICHRISLIPLHFSQEELKNFHPDKFNFVLKKENTTDSMLNVTTEDFEIYDETNKQYPKEFCNRILPPNSFTKDYILITKLKPNLFDKNKGDKIHIEARPSVDKGKAHARWIPTSLCTYYNIVDDKLAEKGLEEYIKEHKNSDLDEPELRARFNTLEIYRFYKRNKYLEPNSFRFELETECGLNCSYIFKTAIEVLIEKLKNFISNIEELNTITVSQSQGMTYFTINGEDHTLGNIIQAMLYNIYIRDTDDNELSYIGYFKPHPLEDNIVIKVKAEKEAPKLVQQGTRKIIEKLDDMLKEWHPTKAT